MNRLFILLLLITSIACGKQDVGVQDSRTPRVILQANMLCSTRAFNTRCTSVNATQVRLVPRQFYSHYCYKMYATCVDRLGYGGRK